MYFDTAYIAKFYLNEPESERIRTLVAEAGSVYSSSWAMAEFHTVVVRHFREGRLAQNRMEFVAARFDYDLAVGLWQLTPVTSSVLRQTANFLLSAPRLLIRAGDAVHLTTAFMLGEREVWTNDRHMTLAAPSFHLTARSL
jgi:predicted nucleic acid-binding protein